MTDKLVVQHFGTLGRMAASNALHNYAMLCCVVYKLIRLALGLSLVHVVTLPVPQN